MRWKITKQKIPTEEIRSLESTSASFNKRINYKGPHTGARVGQVLATKVAKRKINQSDAITNVSKRVGHIQVKIGCDAFSKSKS